MRYSCNGCKLRVVGALELESGAVEHEMARTSWVVSVSQHQSCSKCSDSTRVARPPHASQPKCRGDHQCQIAKW
eukprot:scaffold422_cov19-Tisochrysis_lutea.AAC.1